MKTKNVKLKFSDIKHGVPIHIAHPIYGIESGVIMGKPFKSKYTKSWFVFIRKERLFRKEQSYCIDISLIDAGISCMNESLIAGYNGRRAFRKLKHAQEWQRKWLNDPSFAKVYEAHKMNEIYEYDDTTDEIYEYDDSMDEIYEYNDSMDEYDGKVHLYAGTDNLIDANVNDRLSDKTMHQ